jgi:hypothetical protein
MTFCSQNDEDLADDTLSKAEWEELKQIEALLEPFYLLTKRLEGNAVDGHHGSIWEALPTIEYLLQHLEQAKKKHKRDKFLMTCINLAWDKLHDYYALMDNTPIYALGVFLHPKHRWSYFKKRWDTPNLRKHIEPTLNAIRGLWNEEYKNIISTTSLEAINVENGSTTDILDAFLNEGFESTKDDFELYLAGESTLLKKEQNLFIWWANSGLSQLAQMAFDIFSIPAASQSSSNHSFHTHGLQSPPTLYQDLDHLECAPRDLQDSLYRCNSSVYDIAILGIPLVAGSALSCHL